MTRGKKLKKAIRARAKKTGERYAAARRQVLARRAVSDKEPARPAAKEPTRSGMMKDAIVRARTGRGLDHWFEVLDAFGAAGKGHTASARHLAVDHGVDGWYAQGITVDYERARGLRAPNQRMDGSFEVSVTRTVNAPMQRVVELFSRPTESAAWLRGCDPSLQKSLRSALAGKGPHPMKIRAGKEAYLRYPADGQTIDVRVIAKPDGRSSVVATVMKIPTAAAKEAQRAAWRRAFEALKTHLP